MPQNNVEHIRAVETMRVFAIIAVVIIHTKPFFHSTYALTADIEINVGHLLNQLSRFAVPFFFVISGYFWARGLGDAHSIGIRTRRSSARIAFLFISWSAIYAISTTDFSNSLSTGLLGPFKAIYWNLLKTSKTSSLFVFLFEGTRYHLWYLTALLSCVLISSAFVYRSQEIRLIFFAIILYIVGLCGKAYTDAPFGFNLGFDFRNGPFFGLIFFVTGIYFQKHSPNPSWLTKGLLITIFGYSLTFVELTLMSLFWETTPLQDYVVGTYFIGSGLAMASLSNHKILQLPSISRHGSLVLGIYVCHMLFYDYLKHFQHLFSSEIIWGLILTSTVLLLSFLFAHTARSIKLLRVLVV